MILINWNINLKRVNEPKDFRNYQMPWKLFEDLRDCDTNPKKSNKR